MFDYGKIYGSLSLKDISELEIGKYKINKLLLLVKIYFHLFGYPDVAGHMRYRLLDRYLKLRKSDKLLDAGCGIGIYLHELSKKYQTNCLGIDIQTSRILYDRKLDKLLGQHNKFKISNLEKLDLGRLKFDKIICLEVLEHVKDDKKALKNLHKYLTKKGMAVITVPLSKYQKNHIKEPVEQYGHVRNGYSFIELKDLLEYAGFKNIKIEPYFFLFSDIAVRIQQFFYKRMPYYLNVLFSPLLTIVALLDDWIKVKPRGYIAVLSK